MIRIHDPSSWNEAKYWNQLHKLCKWICVQFLLVCFFFFGEYVQHYSFWHLAFRIEAQWIMICVTVNSKLNVSSTETLLISNEWTKYPYHFNEYYLCILRMNWKRANWFCYYYSTFVLYPTIKMTCGSLWWMKSCVFMCVSYIIIAQPPKSKTKSPMAQYRNSL